MIFYHHDRLVVCGVLALIVGCGNGTTGSGSGGASASSSGGAGGASASTTGAGGTSAATTGAGGAPSGTLITTCYKADKMKCGLFGETNQTQVDAQNSLCTSEGGMPAAHCTSTNLIGCCIVVDIGTCYYEMQAAAMAQASCASFSGKWTTTAP